MKDIFGFVVDELIDNFGADVVDSGLNKLKDVVNGEKSNTNIYSKNMNVTHTDPNYMNKLHQSKANTILGAVSAEQEKSLSSFFNNIVEKYKFENIYINSNTIVLLKDNYALEIVNKPYKKQLFYLYKDNTNRIMKLDCYLYLAEKYLYDIKVNMYEDIASREEINEEKTRLENKYNPEHLYLNEAYTRTRKHNVNNNIDIAKSEDYLESMVMMLENTSTDILVGTNNWLVDFKKSIWYDDPIVAEPFLVNKLDKLKP